MSMLAPLYFAGALAIGLPILFHLIRRTPKSELEFSSLMFLDPTPPRMTRRSRLENWPLLLARATALILLAAAFARPFLRSSAATEPRLPPRRIVLLIDTSASMKRTGLWQQAIEQANRVINELEAEDRVAILSFDHEPTTWLGLDESSRLPIDARKRSAAALLSEIKPTWFGTDTAAALAYAADVTVADGEVDLDVEGDVENADEIKSSSIGEAKIILVSDMQAGSNIEALQSLVWPTRVQVEVRRVMAKDKSNAAAFLLPEGSVGRADAGTADDKVRVRVINAADSTASNFSLRWSSSAAAAIDVAPATFQVPPGQTRIVRMERPTGETRSLIIEGDNHDFDNVRYIAIEPPKTQTLGFVGPEINEPRESLFHYLKRVPLSSATRQVEIRRFSTDEITSTLDPKLVPLIVLAQSIETKLAKDLAEYVRRGGRVLAVIDRSDESDSMAKTIGEISENSIEVSEATVDDYHMLSRIDFSHPMFAAMSDPQFNDFTKVRFWSHRVLSGLDESWSVVARFDDGDAAIVERSMGVGKLIVIPFGWQPSASQLSLSTKFIPFVFRWFGANDDETAKNDFVLGDTPPLDSSESATITNPIGTTTSFATSKDADVIDSPGIYTWNDGAKTRRLAINLPESESRTEPISDEMLESFGVVIGRTVSSEQEKATDRQLRDRELEGRQKLWRWVLVTALGLLGLETWWSGRDRQSAALA